MMDEHQGALAYPNWAGGMQLSVPNQPVTNGVGFRGSTQKGSKGVIFPAQHTGVIL